MRTKNTITKEFAKRYQKARKKEKMEILTEFINLTGYNRSYFLLIGSYLNKIKILFNEEDSKWRDFGRLNKAN